MTINEFIESLEDSEAPAFDSVSLNALWLEGKGNWKEAHTLVQDEESTDAAWVHAYLHRKEGDNWNAGYWYRRAQKPPSSRSLQEEWHEIVGVLLSE